MHCTDALLALLLALKNTSQNQGNKHYYARSTSLEKLSQTLPWRHSTSYKLQISGQQHNPVIHKQYWGWKWRFWDLFWWQVGFRPMGTILVFTWHCYGHDIS